MKFGALFTIFVYSLSVSAADIGTEFGTLQGDGNGVSCSNPSTCGGAVAGCKMKVTFWANTIRQEMDKQQAAILAARTETNMQIAGISQAATGAAKNSYSSTTDTTTAARGGQGKILTAQSEMAKKAEDCRKQIEEECGKAPGLVGWVEVKNQCAQIASKAAEGAANTAKDMKAGGGMGDMAQGLMGAIGALAPLAAQMMQKKNDNKDQAQKPTEYASTTSSLGGVSGGNNAGASAALGATKPQDTSVAVKDFSNPGYSSLTKDDKSPFKYADTANASTASASAPPSEGGGGGGAFGSSGASMAGTEKPGAGEAKKNDFLGNFDLPSLSGGTGRFLGLKGGSGAGSSSPLEEELNKDGAGGDVASGSEDPFSSERDLASADTDPGAEGGSLFKVVGLKIKEMKRRGNI